MESFLDLKKFPVKSLTFTTERISIEPVLFRITIKARVCYFDGGCRIGIIVSKNMNVFERCSRVGIIIILKKRGGSLYKNILNNNLFRVKVSKTVKKKKDVPQINNETPINPIHLRYGLSRLANWIIKIQFFNGKMENVHVTGSS